MRGLGFGVWGLRIHSFIPAYPKASCSLNSLKGVIYIRDYLGEYYRAS